MGQLFATKTWINQITLTTGHDNYDGASSTAGKSGSSTSPGSRIDSITVASRGTNVANFLHVYQLTGAGPTKSYLFSIPLKANTVVVGQTPALSIPWPLGVNGGGIDLPDANAKLAYNLAVSDTGIDVTERGVDYA